MDNRKYNIYFNTHTVSGIIICAILYVMFFAGSFTFFKDDITAWQKNDSQLAHKGAVKKDFNYLIDSLGKKHKLIGRDFDFTIQRNHSGVYVAMSASHDSTNKKKKDGEGGGFGERGGRGEGRRGGRGEGRGEGRGAVAAASDTAGRRGFRGGRAGKPDSNATMIAASATRGDKGKAEMSGGGDKKDGEKGEKKERKGRGRRGDGDNAYFTYDFAKHQEADYTTGYTMGEFLYRLHFLAQVNQVLPFRIGVPFGYLLAGIVSFIFLFALITGLLLHWDKLVSNFFTFRPWNKWKNVWTEAHTVLGVIGFPYQLVFAITGIILIFNSFLIVPYTQLFYKGDQEKIYKDLGYGVKSEFKYTYKPLQANANVDSLVAIVENKWQRSDVSTVAIRNYGDANMHVVVIGKPQTTAQMNGQGEWIYRVRDSRVISERSPLADTGYLATFKGMIYHLHFGDFGGRPLKVIYFVLGILGCVVINSGVMIWLVARDKKSIPERKRKFNFWTANIYLGSSLSMLPVLGVTMIALLFLEKPGQPEIYHWFFYSWLALGIYFVALRNLERVNRRSMFLSAVICLALPIFDGLVRNNWFWVTYAQGAFDILFIDVLFLILGVISAAIYWKISQRKIAPAAKTSASAPRRKAQQLEEAATA